MKSPNVNEPDSPASRAAFATAEGEGLSTGTRLLGKLDETKTAWLNPTS
jgi:hypothetical protein